MTPQNLLERLAKPFLQDHTIILLDRMEMEPELFAKARGTYNRNQLQWIDIAVYGTFPVLDRTIIDRRIARIQRNRTKNDVLNLLVNGVDEHKFSPEDTPF